MLPSLSRLAIKIAGLFLANYPEAMINCRGMKKQDRSAVRIFVMWLSLIVVTCFGAGPEFWVGDIVNHGFIVLI